MVDANESQRDRFIETARAIGANEDEASFKAKLAVIARHKQNAEQEQDSANEPG